MLLVRKAPRKRWQTQIALLRNRLFIGVRAFEGISLDAYPHVNH
jgi:hypothetical protein